MQKDIICKTEKDTAELAHKIAQTAKKGDFTYCDLKGREITGVIKSKGNYIAYYENGELVNGINLYPDGKTVKTYFYCTKITQKMTIITFLKIS